MTRAHPLTAAFLLLDRPLSLGNNYLLLIINNNSGKRWPGRAHLAYGMNQSRHTQGEKRD